MTTPFSAIITPLSVSFTGPDGKVYNIDSSHKNWGEIIETIKELQATKKLVDSFESGIDTFPDRLMGAADYILLHEKLVDLTDVGSKKINAAGAGKVTVVGGVVYYEGEAVHSAITERILWGLEEGFDMKPYMLFLDNAMDNPSARAVDEMYGFMEKNNMGITDDGYILGYKKIREDFTDIYSGKFDNSPGQTITMKRNRVDDNPNRTCSKGLHFCSMAYLPCFGSGPGNRIIIVKVNPRDIVSVPIDYDHAKVRCCEYTVLSEYTGDDKEDLLGSKAVWSDDDFSEDDFEDYDDDEMEADEYEDWRETNETDDLSESKADDDTTSGLFDGPMPETGPEAARRALGEALVLKMKNAAAVRTAPAELSPSDIARYYHENLSIPAEEVAEESETEEVPPAFLSGEGVDMRNIMQTVAEPHTQEGDAMRALIDVVEGKVEEETATNEKSNLVSAGTEDAILAALAKLDAKLEEYKR